MNKLLENQVKQILGSLDSVSDKLKSLLNIISDTYDDFGSDRCLKKHASNIDPQELMDTNNSSRTGIKECGKVEEALRKAEEKYRIQFEMAMDGIFMADAETGILIDCNSAAAQLINREKSEIIGQHQKILHPKEDADGDFSKTFKQHLAQKDKQCSIETKVITKTGEIKDVVISAAMFELGGRKVLQGIFRDVTKQRKAETDLKDKVHSLEIFYKSSVDREMRILELKETVEALEAKVKKLEGK